MCVVWMVASVAIAEGGLSDAAVLEASLRQQWAGIDEQVQLRRIDREALGESAKYREGATAPAPTSGKDGRVVFEFGRSVPKVFCTPFRFSDIELQAGEQVRRVIAGDGDDGGWIVDGALAGDTQHVVVKPRIANISTNLAIFTDRRVYHLELQATASDHMPFVAFRYPEDHRAKWLELARQQGLAGGAERKTATTEHDDYEIAVKPGALNFNYAIEREGRWLMRRRIDWEPKRAFDDGEKTIIEMPRSVLARELPVLFVRDGDGKDKLVNYRVKRTHFIVDRLFTKAVLVKGVGWRQERIAIRKED
jgi:type IV secretion system protein VirB9